jgi:DNA-binding transcriptional regulator YdaS (Cro superfamily)
MLAKKLRTLHINMKLRLYLDTLPRGGVSEFATRIGVSPVYLSQLAVEQDGRVPSPALCVVIERESNRAVLRQDLRPLDWHLIWPELGAVAEVKEAA